MQDRTSEFIKEAFPKLVSHYEHPLAPIKIEDAYNALQALASMLVHKADKEKVIALATAMSDTAQGLGHEPYDEDFLAALVGMLSQALVENTRQLVRGDGETW